MESLKMIGIALLSGLGGCIGGIPLDIFLVEDPSENRPDRGAASSNLRRELPV